MKVAITGGIGSGKSYVCQRLKAMGIAVYDCDREAKRLMRESQEIRDGLVRLVGPDVYIGNVLNKPLLAAYLLRSEANKQAVNRVVHPAVARDFESSGMDWLESAILFESDFCHRTHLDKVVCVVAPDKVRLERIMNRDGISRSKAQAWIDAQMPQEEMSGRSDFVIVNDGIRDIDKQLEIIINTITTNN